MVYLNKSREELIIELKDIQQKHTDLMAVCDTYAATHTIGNNELKASEARYRRLFETAKDGILILDAETGMIKDVNPYLMALLGYSKEQLIEKGIWELGFFKDAASIMEKVTLFLMRVTSLPHCSTDYVLKDFLKPASGIRVGC